MQTVPDPFPQLSAEAQRLLDRLSQQFATALSAVTELIARGYARRTNGGLSITAVGLLSSQTS